MAASTETDEATSGPAKPGQRTFYTMLAVESVSILGSRISGIAIGIWIYRHTGLATPLALVGFFSIVPGAVLGGLGGAVADRFDRRTVMIASNCGFALCTGALLTSFLLGAFQIWQLYAATFIQALCGLVGGPAFQASTTVLVAERHRDRANAIAEITGPAAGIFAPTLAGVFYAVIGAAGALGIDLATFLLAILALLRLRIPMPARPAAQARNLVGALLREAFDGFAYLRTRPTMLALCLYVAVINGLVGAAMILQTPYILARTGSASMLGIVLAAGNAGALAGAIAMSAWGGMRPRIHTIMVGVILSAAFWTLTGVARTPLELALCFFLFLFPIPAVGAAFMSLFQAKTPPEIQGRTFAAVSQINILLLPPAYLAAGPLADNIFEPAVHTPVWRWAAPLVGAHAGAGMGLLFVIAGALTTFVSIAFYALPAIRRMEASLPDANPV